MAGDHYQLCWAPDGGTVSTDFPVDVDLNFELYGPIDQDYACTLGVGCTLNLTGHRLHASAGASAVAFLADGFCGQGASATLAMPGHPPQPKAEKCD